MEAGRYSGRSIALQGDTLRHVGFLGGRAPAVPGLAPTRFSSAPETVVAFTKDGEGEAPDDSTADDPDSLRALEPEGAAQDCGDSGDVPSDGEEEDSGRVALAEKEAALAAREGALLAREAAAAEDDRRRAAEAAIAPHVEAGRVLPAERAAVVALLAALSDGPGNAGAGAAGEDATIAFASVSGGEAQMRPAAILERFIEGLPSRVDCRTLAGGQLPGAAALAGTHEGAGEDSERIAAEARTSMAAEAEKGLALTPVEAVDRARAKRGLGIGGGTQ